LNETAIPIVDGFRLLLVVGIIPVTCGSLLTFVLIEFSRLSGRRTPLLAIRFRIRLPLQYPFVDALPAV
jgi:hypothetical protein